MADYPDTIYTERATENLPGLTYDPADKKNLYSEDFQHHASEIIAIENELGVNPKGVFASVAEFLSSLADSVAEALLFTPFKNVFGSSAGLSAYAWSVGRNISNSSTDQLHFEVASSNYNPNGAWPRWSWVDTSAVIKDTSGSPHWLHVFVSQPAGDTGATLQWTNSTAISNLQLVLYNAGLNFNTTHDPFEVRMYGVQNPNSSSPYVGFILRCNTAWDIGSRFRISLTKGTGINWATAPSTISTVYGAFSTLMPMFIWLPWDGGTNLLGRCSGADVPMAPYTFDTMAEPAGLTTFKTVRLRFHSRSGIATSNALDRVQVY